MNKKYKSDQTALLLFTKFGHGNFSHETMLRLIQSWRKSSVRLINELRLSQKFATWATESDDTND